MGRSGSFSRETRGIDPHVKIRRGEGAQIKWCRETRCSSRVRAVCRGTFWVASSVSSTVSNFKRERGISLETLQRERASSHDDGGNSWFFSSLGGILKFGTGTQGASRVASGKSNLHLSCEGELGISLQGKKTSSRLLSRKSVFLSNGNRVLGVTFKVQPGIQASCRVEAKNSALLSSCDGYLLEPIEWAKGSQASCGVLREDSGLLSRPCRKRRASSPDDGRISCFFSKLRCNVCDFLRVMTEN